MNSFLPITGVISSMILADLSMAVKTSCRLSKTSSVTDYNENGYRIDCMRSGLHAFAFSVPKLTSVIVGTVFQWMITAQQQKSLLFMSSALIRMVGYTSLYRFRLLYYDPSSCDCSVHKV
jgi:hypothetical protein